MSDKLNTRFLDFSRPFIIATKSVFETMVYSKIEPQKPTIKVTKHTEGDITAIMGLSGLIKLENEESSFKGMLVLSWPMETYLKIASAMLMEEHKSFSQEIMDVGAEINNMVTGGAKRDLNGLGYVINMSIPSTVTGKNVSITYPVNTMTIRIPVLSAHGPFEMELSYTEEPLKGKD